MPWVYDYDETVTIDSTTKNKKFVFLGNSSGKAELIYEAPKHWIDIDPTKTTLTQAEFIQIIDAGMQDQMTVGAIITLNNTYCNQYEVIGKNHDGTTGTVDIMSHTQVGNMTFSSSNNTYSSSKVREYLTTSFFNAFDSSIQNLAKTMSVATQSSTVNDKVKALSASEIGVTPLYYMDTEGTKYEAFTAGTYSEYLTNRWRAAGSYGNSGYYWLRSRYTFIGNDVWNVYSGGIVYNSNYSNTSGVVAALRF